MFYKILVVINNHSLHEMTSHVIEFDSDIAARDAINILRSLYHQKPEYSLVITKLYRD